MCDYSLHAVAARPPRLETHLSQSVFQAHPRVALPRAVCLLPGTELVFEDEVKYNRTYLLSRCESTLTRSLGFTVARFCKVEPRPLSLHRDALSFPDGTIALVNMLSEGQCARVLQLPVIPQEKNTVTRADQDPVLDVDSLIWA